jgi:hypothetical protein
MEAIITQLVNKAATGDMKATKLLLEMMSRFPEMVKAPDGPITLVVHPAPLRNYDAPK